jgi:ABC-type multidrug transport system ATPase subunit
MAEPAIRVSSLRKAYGDTHAVDGIDLEIEPAECFALLGPNGAGKTTTVEIMEGYRHADAGTVRVLGEDPARPTPAWRARIGIVLQSASDLADRVAVIVEGRIAALGDPATLGGRRTADALVSWSDGQPREARTSEPTRFVQELAAQFDGEIPELAVRRPTLEDVYLRLVGTQPSDTEAP